MASELLAPAGDFDTALTAFAAGADAVYCGLTGFSARAFAKNFTLESLSDLLRVARAKGKKVYVAFNTILDDRQMDEAERVLPGGSKDPRYHKALIYALAHSRSPEAFPEVVTCKDLERLLKPFFRRLAATPEEVNAALDAVLGVGSAKPREEANSLAAADYAGICARLEGQTGVPAEEWMWKRSGKYAMKVYAELHSFARAYSARGGSFADMRDELDVATERLNLLKLEIAKSVKKGGGK